jgi:hypothetical protein
MNVGELLTELRENILHDRSDRVSGDEDLLWSDATLIRYIDEAQRRLARQALVIRDGTTADVTQVTLVTGQNHYVLHESVMAVLSARYDQDTANLSRAGHSAFDTYRTPDTMYFDPGLISTLAPGKPIAYGTDERMGEADDTSFGAVTMRVYPTPTSTENGNKILLRVLRLPITRLSTRNLRAVPEVPEAHHLNMLDWAAYLALRIVDQDAGMPARAKEFRDSFNATVADARLDGKRKTHAPTTWQFGQNGFAWEY